MSWGYATHRTLTVPYLCGTVKTTSIGRLMSVCITETRGTLSRMTTSRHDQIMKTFAKRLKAARIRAGYTSAQRFAGVLGVEPHSYRKYERGTAEPRFEILVRMCEMLDIETSELLPRSVSKGSKGSGHQAAA